MAEHVFVGIDLGTTVLKAAAFEAPGGRMLAGCIKPLCLSWADFSHAASGSHICFQTAGPRPAFLENFFKITDHCPDSRRALGGGFYSGTVAAGGFSVWGGMDGEKNRGIALSNRRRQPGQ